MGICPPIFPPRGSFWGSACCPSRASAAVTELLGWHTSQLCSSQDGVSASREVRAPSLILRLRALPTPGWLPVLLQCSGAAAGQLSEDDRLLLLIEGSHTVRGPAMGPGHHEQLGSISRVPTPKSFVGDDSCADIRVLLGWDHKPALPTLNSAATRLL